MVDTLTHAHTNVHTHVRTNWWHISQQSCSSIHLRKCKLLISVSCLFSFSFEFSLSFCTFIFLFLHSFAVLVTRQPKPTPFKMVQPPFVTHLHMYLRTHNTWHNPSTGKALSQNKQGNSGKPGYNLALMEPKRFPPGRWALSYWEKPKDRQRKLHPGKCLCSTLGSLAFCPANEWLFVYSGGGVMRRGRFFPSLAFGRGGCWHSLASL